EHWEGQFRLHAVWRFVVSAARSNGETRYVVIESAGGETCHLANPWPQTTICIYCLETCWSLRYELSGDHLVFPTTPSGVYLLLPSGQEPSSLQQTHLAGEPNRAAKTLGIARLGLP